MPRPICFVLFKQAMANALSLALAKAGNSMAARMAMIAITTSNSIRVKADFNGFALTPLWGKCKDRLGNLCGLTEVILLQFIMFLHLLQCPNFGIKSRLPMHSRIDFCHIKQQFRKFKKSHEVVTWQNSLTSSSKSVLPPEPPTAKNEGPAT